MNINKKLSREGQHETNSEIDLYKSKETGNLAYKTPYGKEVELADHAYVEKSMSTVIDNIQDGFNLEFKKDSVGPKVSFIKNNGADINLLENRDIIIPGLLEITRGNNGGGIFNYALEEDYSNQSPVRTYWSTKFLNATESTWGPLTDISNRTYDYWKNAIVLPTGAQAPPQYVGLKTVMAFSNPDTGITSYWLIEFTYWGIGGDGDYGFGYNRYEIFPQTYFQAPSVSNYNTPLVLDIISEGVHLGRNYESNNLFNAVSEDYSNSGVSPKNTRWNSSYTDSRIGYNGFNNLTNVKSRVYTDFYNAVNQNVPDNVSGLELVMHDLTTDLYWQIIFDNWGHEGTPGLIYSYDVTNTGSGYTDGTGVELKPEGGTGEGCIVYVDIVDGIPTINSFDAGQGYSIGDILTFTSEASGDPMVWTITDVELVEGFSYFKQVVPQGDAIKFADGTELDTAPETNSHKIIIDADGNTIVDDTSDNLVYIPEGMAPPDFKHTIGNFSGMLIVNDHYDGRIETWIAGGGDTTLLGSTNAGGSPGSTLSMNGQGYDWTNVDELQGPFTFTVIKTRQGS